MLTLRRLAFTVGAPRRASFPVLYLNSIQYLYLYITLGAMPAVFIQHTRDGSMSAEGSDTQEAVFHRHKPTLTLAPLISHED